MDNLFIKLLIDSQKIKQIILGDKNNRFPLGRGYYRTIIHIIDILEDLKNG